MLPVIAGTKTTKTNILVYSFAMLPIVLLHIFLILLVILFSNSISMTFIIIIYV
jgi:heme O synthase-like polyprenyltransferase